MQTSALQFLGLPENQLFVIALVLMLGIAVVELCALALGGGVGDVLDSLVPDFEVDIDGSAAGQAGGLMTRLLGWLHIGKVPILITLIALLTVFGLLGLFVQWLILTVFNVLVPGFWMAVPVLIVSMPLVHRFAHVVHRLMPADETEAVSAESFVGRMATITLGTASKDNPAQARVTDEFGKSHYVMLEPFDEADEFSAGERVLAVERRGPVFIAIRSDSSGLS